MNNQSKILIVEDSKVDQMIIRDILTDYKTISVYDGVEAIEYLQEDCHIDMMILDLNMPRMNGFQVLERLKTEPCGKDISVIILTNYEEIQNEIRGLELGAVDYIRKPLNAESLLKRLEVHLNLIHARKEIQLQNQDLEERVRLRTEELERSRDITSTALLGLLEVRDIESSNHTKRTQLMMRLFCEHLAKFDPFAHIMTESHIEYLYKATPLHDMGKVGIKDEILLKPGKLTSDEFETMKNHVKFGVDALTKELTHDHRDEFIVTAVKIISAHHEKYDGTGYPMGLCGEDIPLEGRLMAIIDVYDALTSKRVYKDAFSHDYALSILVEDKGSHFDPYLIDRFLEIEKDIMEIAVRYRQESLIC